MADALPRPAPPAHVTPKYAFIDALRGIAVLMVITAHTGNAIAQLPSPLRRLTDFGYNGVQLFFLLSCLTLLLSWQSDARRGRTSLRAFWLRRLFRIVPMYYAAALYYYVTEPPAGGFDLAQLLATLGFVNAWHPLLVPTVPGRWVVVPGGWSIGVEMIFYLVLPLIATWCARWRAALLLCAATIVLAPLCNAVMAGLLHPSVGAVPVAHFLFFWPPNQMPVFALGLLLFLTLEWTRGRAAVAARLARHSTALLVASAAACIVIDRLALPNRLLSHGDLAVPEYLAASLVFIVAILALAHARSALFTPAILRSLGRVSFSAYLLHFSVLHLLVAHGRGVFDAGAEGWAAVGAFFVLWLAAVPLTWAFATLTYHGVEAPMIRLGRRCIGNAAIVLPAQPARSAAA